MTYNKKDHPYGIGLPTPDTLKIKGKQWWHDWNYKYNSSGAVILAMPNAKGELKEIRFRRVQDPRIRTLIDWWICAMDQLQRDNGGYEK